MKHFKWMAAGLLSLWAAYGTVLAQSQAVWSDSVTLNPPRIMELDTTVDVSGLNLGTASGHQVWNFTPPLSGDTTISDWLEVDGTPYDTAFTDADWVEHFIQYAPRIAFRVREDWNITVPAQLVEMFRYHRRDSGWIRTLGMGFQYDLMWGAPFVYDAPSYFYPDTLTADTEPWLEMYSFQSRLVNLFPSTITDSTRIQVDAWGELTIPAGTFECIRVKRREFRNIYIAAFDTSAQLETYTYTWFDKDFQPLLSISSQATHGDTIETANLVSRFEGYPEDTTDASCDPGSCRRIDDLHPERFELSQNFPNPFNPSTVIRFSLSVLARVRLDIFDVRGRLVDRIRMGYQTAGRYEWTWNMEDRSGVRPASGIYYYRITADPVSGGAPFARTRKMMLLR